MYINGRWTEDPEIINSPYSIAAHLWFDNAVKYLDVSDPQKLAHADFRVASYRAVHKYLDDVLLPHQQHLRSKVLGEWLIKVVNNHMSASVTTILAYMVEPLDLQRAYRLSLERPDYEEDLRCGEYLSIRSEIKDALIKRRVRRTLF